MEFKRIFVPKGTDPFSMFQYEAHETIIRHHVTGKVMFQYSGDVPKHWSVNARDVVISKYFRKGGVPDSTVAVTSGDDANMPAFLRRRQPTVTANVRGEQSIKEVLHRIVGAWTYHAWLNLYFEPSKGQIDSYPNAISIDDLREENAKVFYDEQIYISLKQMGAPNSPQWFNTGLNWAYGINGPRQGHWFVNRDHYTRFNNSGSDPTAALESCTVRSPDAYSRVQAHACFILNVNDTMFNGENGIFEWYNAEGLIFKYGSGSGANLSKLRAEGEKLSGGGKSSGLMSWMKVADYSAGAIKSGGTTRRAAKMVCLDADHPDILKFIQCKSDSELTVAAMAVGSAAVTVCCQSIIDAVFKVPPITVTPENVNDIYELVTGSTWVREQMQIAAEAGVPHNYIDKAVRWALEGHREWPGHEFNTEYEGEAYSAVAFQNANNSVRLPQEFYDQCDADEDWSTKWRTTGEVAWTVKARKLERDIAEATWFSGDPGAQYDTNINEWNVTPEDGRIRASNPCQPANATVLTQSGISTIGKISVGDSVWTGQRFSKVIRKINTGVKPVFEYRTTAGRFLGTDCHKVFSCGIKVEAGNAESIDTCKAGQISINQPLIEQDVVDGWVLGDGSIHKASNDLVYLNLGANDGEFTTVMSDYVICHRPGINQYAWEVRTTITADELPDTYERSVPLRFKMGSTIKVASFLRGLYSANGSVCGGRITLKAASRQVIHDVQDMLSSLGIASYYTTNRAKVVNFSNGDYPCRESYDLNITTDRKVFQQLIGFVQSYKHERMAVAASRPERPWQKKSFDVIEVLECGEQPVWDIEVEANEHSYWTGGLLVSNCSEHMRLDDSGCNLASNNLTRFYENGRFQVARFMHAVDLYQTTLDVTICMSHFPTKGVAMGIYNYRDTGLGYCDLGALIMSMGLAYDSDEGRAVAAAVTALMQAQAHLTSAKIAEQLGPYPRWTVNREHHLRCVRNHIAVFNGESFEGLTNPPPRLDQIALHRALGNEAAEEMIFAITEAFDEAYKLALNTGFRNAEMTVLAPTGTISFVMEADTTGVEPMLAVIVYKTLAGGGTMVVEAADCVRLALQKLGYDAGAILTDVNTYLKDRAEAKERASADAVQDIIRKHLTPEHHNVFDTSLGKYAIPWQAHVKMMGVTQAFLSGAISKTVNMPGSATVDEIRQAYRMANDIGVKAIAIYRDGSKLSQPLNIESLAKLTDETDPKSAEVVERLSPEVPPGGRMLLNWLRNPGVDIRVKIGNSNLYVRTTRYPDGRCAEIWVTYSADQGIIMALIGSIMKTANIALQWGVPLEQLIDSWSDTVFEPRGVVGLHPYITQATSLLNLIARLLDYHELGNTASLNKQPNATEEVRKDIKPITDVPNHPRVKITGESCPNCGSQQFVTSGANCKKCLNCGSAGGCG